MHHFQCLCLHVLGMNSWKTCYVHVYRSHVFLPGMNQLSVSLLKVPGKALNLCSLIFFAVQTEKTSTNLGQLLKELDFRGIGSNAAISNNIMTLFLFLEILKWGCCTNRNLCHVMRRPGPEVIKFFQSQLSWAWNFILLINIKISVILTFFLQNKADCEFYGCWHFNIY